MSVAAETFRAVFRQWPSGVAVVSSRARTPLGEITQGMVVSSFCSLSADPPLVMFSASRSSRTHDVVAESGVYAVSILSESQGPVFERFAGLDPVYDDDRFAGLATVEAVTGAPILPDAIAWVDCRVIQEFAGEKYTIFVGEVLDAALGAHQESLPLLYFRRARHQLAVNAPAGSAV
ncbi:MAG: flavin reductase family protein [Chloroflexi bacterium]|nr:flavin reductase family protein [Chloroflexota bacterium]